jgi:protease-4
MKQFFKYVFASALGLIVGIFLIIILGAIIGASMGGEEEVEVKENTVLRIDLSVPIMEQGSDNPFQGLSPFNFKPQESIGLNQILKALENAAKDEHIKGIYLDMNGVECGMATATEIRNGLLKFKESGKFVVAYSEVYSQKEYYLASVADEVWLNPAGLVEWRGLASQIMFYKNMLEKLEVEPQVIRYGKFKSAVEPFMLDKMSEANRLQTSTYVNALWDVMVEGIAETRGTTVAALDSIADNALVQDAKDALEHGLVDSLVYKDQVLADLRARLGVKEADGKINSIDITKYKSVPPVRSEGEKDKGLAKDKVAVIYANGSIESGESSDDAMGSETISKLLRKAREDKDVKAVVLRVNSPGGSALASDVMWRETVLIKQAGKPFIVSMGDVAASGGYYISCAADTIVAQPNTITGSIGVFGLLPNAQKMLNNKLGINIDTVKTNRYADLGSIFRPLTDGERQIIQNGVNDIYHEFIGKVAEGRGMTTADIDSIGQGRVWSGRDALRIGLVDVIGGLDVAIKIAAEKAKLTDYRTQELPEVKDPFEQIMADLKGDAEETAMRQRLGQYYPFLKDMEQLARMKGVQARLPFVMHID